MYSFNKFLSALLALGALAVIYFWLKKLSDKEENKGKEIGVIIMDLLAQNGVSIFMLFLIGFNLASAVIAASITDERSNPVARIVTHFSINALATVGAFNLIPKGRMLFKWKKDEKTYYPGGVIFSRVATFAILVTAAIILPIENVWQIAHALGQSGQLDLYFASHSLFISDAQFIKMVLNANVVPIDQAPFYKPFQNLNNIVVTELVLLQAHFLIIAYEIFNSHDAGVTAFRPTVKPDKDKKKGDKPSDKADEKGDDKGEEQSKVGDYLASVNNILAFLKIPVTEEFLKASLQVIETTWTAKQMDEFAAEISKMLIQIKDYPNAKPDAQVKIKDDIEKAIRERFAKSRKQGGFGQSLRKRED